MAYELRHRFRMVVALVPLVGALVVACSDDDGTSGSADAVDTGNDTARDGDAEAGDGADAVDTGDDSPEDSGVDDAADAALDAALDIDVAPDVPGDSADDAADAPPDVVDEDAGDAGVDTLDAADASDGGPGDLTTDGAEGYPDPPDCGEEQVLITREAEDAGVSFRLDRCMPFVCAGGCPVFQPQLTIVTGTRFDVATSEDIEYTMTHHNWFDSLIGTLPDRRLHWRVEFDFEDTLVERHVVAIETLDGTPILEATEFSIDPF